MPQCRAPGCTKKLGYKSSGPAKVYSIYCQDHTCQWGTDDPSTLFCPTQRAPVSKCCPRHGKCRVQGCIRQAPRAISSDDLPWTCPEHRERNLLEQSVVERQVHLSAHDNSNEWLAQNPFTFNAELPLHEAAEAQRSGEPGGSGEWQSEIEIRVEHDHIIENRDGDVIAAEARIEEEYKKRKIQALKEEEYKMYQLQDRQEELGKGARLSQWTYDGLKKRLRVGQWRDTELLKQKGEQKNKRHHLPARAYQFGNTIIVEDEDGEVVKKYEVPSQNAEGSGAMSQGLRVMGMPGMIKDTSLRERSTALNQLAPGSDSGYGTMSSPMSAKAAASRDEDAVSIASVITDGTEIRVPIEDDLLSAFIRDLRKDIDFPMPLPGGAVDNLIVARLPSLLKTFTLRLERLTRSELENKAKRFIRQKRARISKQLQGEGVASDHEDQASSDDDQTKSRQDPEMSVEEKIRMAGWGSGDDFEQLPDDNLEWDGDPELYLQVRSFLVDGPAYQWLVKNARASFVLTARRGTAVGRIAQTMGDVISSMRERRSQISQEFEAEFRIDWDLITFLENQGYSAVIDDTGVFGDIITLTGTAVNAQALVCKEYMLQTWPSTGHEVLALVQNALRSSNHTHECLLDDRTKVHIKLKPSGPDRGATVVTASGDEAALTELCEQLAWLGAALRPSPPSFAVCIATPQADIWKMDRKDQATIIVDLTFAMSPSTKHETPTQIEGACWHSMFRNPVIVEGFPTPLRHHNEHGLEVPFDLMAALAGTDFVTYWNETFLLKGASTMLVPTSINHQETVVWHFLFNTGARSMPYYAFKTRCPSWIPIPMTTASWSDIGHMRNFVGWASQITRHSGTKDIKYEEVDYTFGPPIKAGVAIEQKLTLSAAKYIGASISVVRGDRDKPVFLDYSGFDQHIQNARRQCVLMYDGSAKRGWLVDGASALLYTVRTQVAQRKDLARFAGYRFDDDRFACPAEDAGPDAAMNILLDDDTLKLVIRKRFASYETTSEDANTAETERQQIRGEESANIASQDVTAKSKSGETTKAKYEVTTIRDFIAGAWGALEQIQNLREELFANHTKAQLPDIDSVRRVLLDKKRLGGYQFQDIVHGKPKMTFRTIELSSNGREWIKFTNQVKSIVLFGEGFGEIYKPTRDLHLCKEWISVPTGGEYLAVPISLLKEIKRKNFEEGVVFQESHEIAEGLTLRGPRDIFQLCDRNCQHKCERVLSFGDGSALSLNQFSDKDGAILLGESSLLARSQSLGGTMPNRAHDIDYDSGIGSSKPDHSESDFVRTPWPSQHDEKEKNSAKSALSSRFSFIRSIVLNEAKPSMSGFESSPGFEVNDNFQNRLEEEATVESAKEDRGGKEEPCIQNPGPYPAGPSQLSMLDSPADVMGAGGQDAIETNAHDTRLGNKGERGRPSNSQMKTRQKERFRERLSKVAITIKGALRRKPR